MIRDPLNWTPPPRPSNAPIGGTYVNIEPWDAEQHAEQLWESFGRAEANELLYHFGWQQMNTAEDLAHILNEFNQTGQFITCVFTEPKTGVAVGMSSYMAIVPEHGRVEVGCVAHGIPMQRSRASTEAHYLMARRAFDELGYRRYEWKLNNPNEPSHKAAKRFGFTYEGVFRQHMVMPYGNRDTAWYSMLDHEWPRIRRAFEQWLDASNFDDDGRQKQSLQAIRDQVT
ncbi:MAG: GNAT family protein [Pseudomonadota bacterium]